MTQVKVEMNIGRSSGPSAAAQSMDGSTSLTTTKTHAVNDVDLPDLVGNIHTVTERIG